MSTKIVYFLLLAMLSTIFGYVLPNSDLDSYENNIVNISITDSIYKSLQNSKNISDISRFILNNPDHDSIKKMINIRRGLFNSLENVILSEINIDSILEVNPCYIPIYKNIDRTGRNVFKFSDLYSDSLSVDNPYRNRFLVADLNTVDKNQISRGVREIFPNIYNGWEFEKLFNFFKKHKINKNDLNLFSDIQIDSILNISSDYKSLIFDFQLYKNYLEKIKFYEKEPINKLLSINRGKKVVTGQNICLCEINNDTINFVGKFVTSARGKTRVEIIDSIEDNPIQWQYSKSMPIGKYKKYYAPLYHIANRHWDTQRKYEIFDFKRDSIMGGGLSKVVYFDGKSQLPNFLTMEPDKNYPRAVRRNGIHESSLSIVSKCMLGSPQSLGCLRMSDYSSKFLRWWTPRGAKLFVYYDEDRYHDEISGNTVKELPFRNIREGNVFRRWVNVNHKDYAKKLDLDVDGACDNCYIYQAWVKFKDEFLSSDSGKKFINRVIVSNDLNENHL